MFWTIAGRIRQEERLMIREFGDEYIQYMKRTGAFCPWTVCDCGVDYNKEEKEVLLKVGDGDGEKKKKYSGSDENGDPERQP